jgi:hypothetical protein
MFEDESPVRRLTADKARTKTIKCPIDGKHRYRSQEVAKGGRNMMERYSYVKAGPEFAATPPKCCRPVLLCRQQPRLERPAMR